MSRGPLVFDKPPRGSVGLSHAVYDAAAVPQQQRISHLMLQPRPLAHQMLMLPRVTLQHSATERDSGGTGQTQTPGPDPINLQPRLRLSMMKFHLCFVSSAFSRSFVFVLTLCVPGTMVQSCHVSFCASTAVWERSLGSTSCLLVVVQRILFDPSRLD